MANIDTLDIQFNAKTDDAVKNIREMATAVSSLSQNLKALNGSNLEAFVLGMSTIKGSIPSDSEVARMVALADATEKLASVIGAENVASFSRAISEVGQEAQTVANEIGQATKKMADRSLNEIPIEKFANGVIPQLDRIPSRVEKIKSLFKGIAIPTKPFKDLEEKADKVAKKYDDLRQKMSRALANGMEYDSSEFMEMEAELDALRNKYDSLIMKQKELALSGGAIQLNPTVKGTLNAFAQGFTRVTDIVKNGFSAAFRKANGLVKTFASNIKSAAKSTKNLVTGGNSATDMAKKFAKELVRVTKMLKLMVTRMALRAVIKEVGNGFKSLALHSEQFDKTMSDVINASKQLGYSFSAMVAPLINALAPAIIYIIDLLTKLINVINQVFSALSGASTWNKAVKFTDKWSDSIKNAGKSGSKAAKELKKTVLGFDELNQLQDNKSSSGGGGSDIKDMFETVEIDPKWKEFADWLKDMWKNKDFTDLGKLIGTKIRDVLESIPWDKIRKTSNDLGKCVASLINGLVEVERLGYDIGYTLAQGVNTVFEFFNGFVHKLHWDSVGKFIAETFNGFFENIDWKLIKDTVVTGMAGIAKAIQTFIDTFHWDNISTFIINAVDTIVSGIKAFFEGIKWGDLGHKIGEQITKSIQGINWREIGEAIGEILQAAIDFFAGIIDEINVDDVVKAASDMFNGFFDKVDTEKLGRTLGKVLQFVISFIKKFLKQNLPRMIEEAKKFFKGIFEGVNPLDIAAIIYAIVNVAVLGGVMSAIKYVLGVIASKAIGSLIAKAIFGTGATSVASSLAAGASAAGTQAGTALTTSMGAGITAGTGTVTTACSGLASALGVVGIAAGETTKFIYDTATAVEVVKTPLFNLAEALGADKEKVDNLKESYSGFNGTLELYKTAIGEAWYTMTGQTEKLEELHKRTKEVKDETGETTKVIDYYGNVVEDNASKVDGLKTSTSNLIKVYQSEKDYLADVQKGHDNVVGSYKTHWDIVNQTKDATDKLTGTFKTHEDVIREYNTKLAEATTGTERVYSSEQEVVGYAPTYIKSMNDMQTAMGDTSKVAEDTGKQIVEGIKEPMRKADFSEETRTLFDVVFKGLSIAFGIASPAKNMMPIGENIVLGVDAGMESEYKSFDSTISDFYNNHVKTWFDKDKWSFSGVSEGLKSTFEGAKKAIGSVWNSIADNVNGEHEIGSSKIKINLPKFKYATGGFPEDGFFFANHNELVGGFSNGKTAVANNAQIVEGIERGVYSAVSSAMANSNGGSQYISNEIIVDGDVIARTITKAQEKQARRYSPQTV